MPFAEDSIYNPPQRGWRGAPLRMGVLDVFTRVDQSRRRTMGSPKITLIGAGGLSFGPTMVNDVIHTPALAGSRLMLHDVNAQRLQRAYRFAAKLNAGKGTPVILKYSTDPAEAL